MESYSKELRRDVLRASVAGEGTRAVALRFGVCESWVRRVKQTYRESGKVEACKTRKRVPLWEPYRERIHHFRERPDLTLRELRAALGTTLTEKTLCLALQRLKLTLKKKSFTPPNRIGTTSPSIALYWKLTQAGVDPDRFVFLDEFGANTKLVRTRGRAPSGERLVEKVPHGHWKNTTFLAGLRTMGLVAPLAIDGPLNGDLFVAYVRQQLTPTLKPGDIVVLDNLSSHKRVEARKAIENVRARIAFLPPYSPDLNPIEQAISKVKRGLRDAGARTYESLCTAFNRLFDSVSNQEAKHYIQNSGYQYS